jgi:hypothetical protein
MTYTVETRPDAARTQETKETTEMAVLRKTAGKTLLDRVRSKDIRCICRVEEIKTCVKRRKNEWNDHINRVTEHCIVRIARDKYCNRTMKYWMPM